MVDIKTVQAPLPCPLCGGADVYVAWDEYGSGGQGVGPAHVGCSRCALDMTDLKGETLEDAIAAWNRRALIAQMQRDAGRRFCGRCGDPLMSDGTDLCYCCNQTMMQRDAVQLVATRIIETPHTHPDSWQPAPEPQQDDHAGSPAPSEPAEWNGSCVMGHCGFGSCEDMGRCMADTPTSPQDEQALKLGRYVEQWAQKAGWNRDDGEGAFEFIQRKSYRQGWEDGKRECSGDIHRDTQPSAQSSKAALSDEQIQKLAKDRYQGAIHTELSGKVELWPEQYRATQRMAFMDGARATLARAGIGESRREPQA